MKIIPYAKQFIDKKDISEVAKALKKDFITQGPTIEKFEEKISKLTKSKFSVAANSATSLLHISCLALGLKKGDYLWTTANSYLSSATCALHCGARVDFIDIDNKNFNLSIEYLEKKLKKAKKNKKLPKIVIPVSLGGNPCEMRELKKLSLKYKFKIIEDASHSIGSYYEGKPVGSNIYADITIFSFHAVKIITTGEGGMATTNSSEIYKNLKLLRSQGVTRDKKYFVNKKNPGWYYEQKNLGLNYRMTDFQAALGISQVKKIKKFINKRNNLANIYKKNLVNLPLDFQYVSKNSRSSYHLFIAKIKYRNSKKIRDQLYNYLKKKGISCNLHYIPIYRHPYFFKNQKFNKNDFPNTENYYNSAITLPLYYSLKNSEINYVIKNIKTFFKIFHEK